MAEKILLGTGNLSVEFIFHSLKNNASFAISNETKTRVNKARKVVEDWIANGETIYGVTTGFGEFSNVKIDSKSLEQLQENLIMSHAAGMGDEIPPHIVKLMMILRANTLALGHSGIKLETLQLLIELINKNIIPVVPSQGSVGSSGDLVPLSHIALALIGKTKVRILKNIFSTENLPAKISSSAAMNKFGLQKIKLAPKEGIALINGTQMMLAFAVNIIGRAKLLAKYSDVALSLSHEALRATDKFLDERIHKLRPFKGQTDSAKNIRALINGSEIRESHRFNDPRVQDAYSLRCSPQVHGASRDAIAFIEKQINTEINSVTDNPILFANEKEHLEGGNFHGQPLALPLDFLAIALSELANISERRIERMVNGALNNGLPRFLAKNGGLNSGMMIAQYTAASIVSENKVLSHPASVDSIPTSANQEDHNSMGSISAQKCFKILHNLEKVLAIEMTVAAQALEFLKPLKPGKGTSIVYEEIRKVVKQMGKDRILSDDLNKILQLLQSDKILTAVETKIKLF